MFTPIVIHPTRNRPSRDHTLVRSGTSHTSLPGTVVLALLPTTLHRSDTTYLMLHHTVVVPPHLPYNVHIISHVAHPHCRTQFSVKVSARIMVVPSPFTRRLQTSVTRRISAPPTPLQGAKNYRTSTAILPSRQRVRNLFIINARLRIVPTRYSVMHSSTPSALNLVGRCTTGYNIHHH